MESLEQRTLLTTFVAGDVLTGDGQSGGNGSEIGDFDQDGDNDVFSASWGFATVFQNQGGAQNGTEGNFAVGQTISQSTGIFDLESGDFDGDGDVDLVGTGQPGIELFINQGGDQGGTLGEFVNTSLPGISIQGGAISVGDLDRDGDLDLFITGRDGSKLAPTTGSGHGFVAYMNQGGAQGGTEGDFAAGFLASSFDLGITAFHTGWFGYGSELGDVDGDGDLDVVSGRQTSSGHGTYVLLNQGAAQGGTEGDFAYSGQVAGLNQYAGAPDPTVTDFDGDGDLDFISINANNLRLQQIQVNQGGAQGGTEGTFAPGQSLTTGGNHIPRAFDMDGDGDQDLFNGRVHFNQGGLQGGTEGVLTVVTSFIPETRADNSYGDLDGDGDLDFFAGRPRQILLNEAPQAPSNEAPEIAADAALVTVGEGDTAGLTGTFSDAEGNSTVALSASSGTVTQNNADGTWSWLQGTDDGPADGTSVTITATDDEGETAEAHFTLVVSNVAPTVNSVSSSNSDADNASGDGNVSVSGSFGDPGLDTHTVTVDWGDGTSEDVSVDQTADSFSGEHTYSSGGIFTVTVTVTDSDGADSVAETTTAVVQGAGLVDGALYVIGTGENDQIDIRRDPRSGDIKVDARLGRRQQHGQHHRGHRHHNGRHGQHSHGPAYQDRIRLNFDAADVTKIVVHAGAGDDHIHIGNDGHSRRFGSRGSDLAIDTMLFGGAGRDHIRGGLGNDVIDGGAGNDTIVSRSGDDTIVDMSGHNWIWSGRGNDVVTTGSGNDRIYTDSGDDIINAGNGRNVVWAGSGNDVVITGSGNDWISGHYGNDVIVGGGGNDRIYGGFGNDILIGGTGRDDLKGSRGNDLLVGGSVANQNDLGALDAALSAWRSGNLADALLALGNDVDDLDRDNLKGQSGADQLIGGAGDRLRN